MVRTRRHLPTLLALLVFGTDVFVRSELVVGMLYGAVVLLALSDRHRSRLVPAAMLCAGLTVLAPLLKAQLLTSDVLLNRLLVILLLAAVTLVARRHHAVVEAMASHEDLEQLNLELRKEIVERQQMEETLRRSQEHLAQAQEVALMGSWDWHLPTGRITWSDELYRIHGIEPLAAETSYERTLALVHPDDRQLVQRVLEQTARTGAPFRFQYRIVRPDGTIRTLLARGEGQHDGSGRLLRIFGTGQDITELKEAEGQLEQSRQQLRALSVHLQSVREEERTKIAREIHDELGQALTALKIDLAWLNRQAVTPVIQQKIHTMIALINETIQTVRRIATELRPAILDDLGLPAALEWQAQEFEKRTGIRCELKISREVFVAPRPSTELFRMFQEMLTNVARHARATVVSVDFRLQGPDVLLEVKDNGVGIRDKEIHDPRSIGLTGLRERVQLLEGDIQITGIPGQGTAVAVRVPADRIRQSA